MELFLVPLAVILQAGIAYFFIEKIGGSRDARTVFATAGRASLSQSLLRSTELANRLPGEDSGARIFAFPTVANSMSAEGARDATENAA